MFPIQPSASAYPYEAVIQVPEYFVPSTYQIQWMDIRDQRGNEFSLHLDSNGYYKSWSRRAEDHNHYNQGNNTPLAAISVTVAGGTGHNPDTVGPNLVSITNFPTTINADTEYMINITATDSGPTDLDPDRYMAVCMEIKEQNSGSMSHTLLARHSSFGC